MTITTVHRAMEFTGVEPTITHNLLHIDELETGSAFLEIQTSSEEDGNSSTQTGRIYLNPAQWAELAQVALKYSADSEESAGHWLNDQVAAWQENNRHANELADRITAIKRLYRINDYYPEYHTDTMEQLEAEGFAESITKEGNHRWWRLTPAGITHAEFSTNL